VLHERSRRRRSRGPFIRVIGIWGRWHGGRGRVGARVEAFRTAPFRPDAHSGLVAGPCLSCRPTEASEGAQHCVAGTGVRRAFLADAPGLSEREHRNGDLLQGRDQDHPLSFSGRRFMARTPIFGGRLADKPKMPVHPAKVQRDGALRKINLFRGR
jgi:hypothetical protein